MATEKKKNKNGILGISVTGQTEVKRRVKSHSNLEEGTEGVELNI